MSAVPATIEADDSQELTPAQESRIAVDAGLTSDAPRRIRASAKFGKTVNRAGELEYVVGNETRIIETLFEAITMQKAILEMNKSVMTPVEVGSALERIAKIGETISRANKNVINAVQQQTNKTQGKNRNRSFAPDQVVHAVQVNVNGGTATVSQQPESQ